MRSVTSSTPAPNSIENTAIILFKTKMSSTTMNGAPAEPITRSSKDWSTASKPSRSNRVMLATRIPNRANPRSTSMATIRSTRPTGAAGVNPVFSGSLEVSDATTACLPLWCWYGGVKGACRRLCHTCTERPRRQRQKRCLLETANTCTQKLRTRLGGAGGNRNTEICPGRPSGPLAPVDSTMCV